MEKTEAQILKSIKLNLKLICPDVIHIDRLQSGMVQKGPYWMRLCVEGTPDMYAIIRDKNSFGYFLFIEAKKIGGKQSPAQKEFQYMVSGLEHIHYVVAHSVSEVADYINKLLDKPAII